MNRRTRAATIKRAAAAGRGAMVFDGAPAQVATQKIRAQALKSPTRTAFPLTVAGVAIPLKDELGF